MCFHGLPPDIALTNTVLVLGLISSFKFTIVMAGARNCKFEAIQIFVPLPTLASNYFLNNQVIVSRDNRTVHASRSNLHDQK